MLKITKRNNSVVVEGINNSLYPYKGQLTFPVNSLMLVLDSSDIATFKSVADADVAFSAIISDILIDGTQATKENIKTLFDSVSNAKVGGGGGSVTVDAELSTTSENPVQNKVITNELSKKIESVELTLAEYQGLQEKKNNVMYVITDAIDNCKIVNLTQSDYDSLTEKDPSTLYVITDAPEIDLTDMATMTWVTEQINAAIAQVNEKITEINNKII